MTKYALCVDNMNDLDELLRDHEENEKEATFTLVERDRLEIDKEDGPREELDELPGMRNQIIPYISFVHMDYEQLVVNFLNYMRKVTVELKEGETHQEDLFNGYSDTYTGNMTSVGFGEHILEEDLEYGSESESETGERTFTMNSGQLLTTLKNASRRIIRDQLGESAIDQLDELSGKAMRKQIGDLLAKEGKEVTMSEIEDFISKGNLKTSGLGLTVNPYTLLLHKGREQNDANSRHACLNIVHFVSSKKILENLSTNFNKDLIEATDVLEFPFGDILTTFNVGTEIGKVVDLLKEQKSLEDWSQKVISDITMHATKQLSDHITIEDLISILNDKAG